MTVIFIVFAIIVTLIAYRNDRKRKSKLNYEAMTQTGVITKSGDEV